MENRLFYWWKKNHQKYQALLMDIDGTLATGGHPLGKTLDFLAWLRRQHYPFCLLTNDGNNSPVEKRIQLANAGIEVDESEIVSCAMALDSFAQNARCKNQLFFVAGELGEPCYAQDAGLQVTRDIEIIDQCAGVIIGEGVYDWRKTLSAVFNAFVKDRDKLLIVPNPDSYWPRGMNGEFGIGAGGKARFIASLLAEAGIFVKPIYLGKPYKAIFERAMVQLSMNFPLGSPTPGKILMAGDSLKSDIRGAKAAGLMSALVLTGITNRKMLAKASREETPDMVFDSL